MQCPVMLLALFALIVLCPSDTLVYYTTETWYCTKTATAAAVVVEFLSKRSIKEALLSQKTVRTIKKDSSL